MATNNPLPADILFAQKASACVKAAGLDPRTMDLKKFRAMAVTIFTRAYQGIYKEYDGIISDPQNESEQASNAQKVINGLFKKTGNDALNEIVGHDVVCGSHKAIGVLVGILYAEGNRLWQEKLNRIEASRTKSRNDETEESLQKKKKAVKKSKKRRMKKSEEEAVPESDVQDAMMHDGMENSTAVSVPVAMIHESSSQAAQEGREEYRGGVAAVHHGVEGVPVRRIRPKSAPSQRISSSQAAACNRLYRHDNRHRKAVDAHVAVHGHVKPWLADNMPPPVPGTCSNPQSPNYRKQQQQQQSSDPPVIPAPQEQPHTYDPITGRRITLVEYHAKMAELHKKKLQDAVGNLKHGSDLDDHKKGNNPTTDQNHHPLPPVPTKPVWPGKSTGNSVDKWMQRMIVARVGAEPVDPNAAPRYYKAYNLLEKMDLVISIEHCFNCVHHCSVIETSLA